jgi:hypothetical protein
MGIADLRQQLSDIPGGGGLVMDYESGTGWQLFKIGDAVARVSPMASTTEIKSALLYALADQQKILD